MKNIGTALVKVQLIGSALFGLAACAVLSVLYMVHMTDTQHVGNLRSLVVAEEIADLLSEKRIAGMEMVLHGARRNVVVVRNTRMLDAKIASLQALTGWPSGSADFVAFELAWDRYKTRQQRWMDKALNEPDPRRLISYHDGMNDAHAEMEVAVNGVIDRLTRHSGAVNDRTRNLINSVIKILSALIVLGGVLHVLLFKYVNRKVVDPLAEITRSLSDLAAGDLDVVVSGGGRQDEVGALVRALEIFRRRARDLEVAHGETREAQAHADSLAHNDVLTGLPNRRQFVESLTCATQNRDEPFAVLLIDLKRFKPINEIHGFEVGDLMLCELADRFVRHRTEVGVIARLGEDEFAVMIPTRDGLSAPEKAAQRICEIVSQPIEIGGARLEVGASIGIALYPEDFCNPSALLRAAGLAMRRAKSETDGSYRFFEPSMHERAQQRAFIDADLPRAIMAGEIRPHYQPLVSIDDSEVVGFEILARWHHPTRGIIMPDQFIAAADERGLLTDMTYQIFRQACEDARAWPRHLTLSLNLAPSQLSDPLLAARLRAILDQAGIAPERIEIEVTENALITDLDATKALLLALRTMGMTISLDDFGTGYASLYQLRDLKFDKIKIDRSFVERIDQQNEGNILIRAMISLGKSLGIATTAEGVEEKDQLARLSDWGCDFGQGYLFGRAMTAAQATQFVNTQSKPVAHPSALYAVANTNG